MKRFIPFLLILLLIACSNRPASTWQAVPLDSPSTASLRGLSVVSETVVWASGSGGTVLRSIDGGASWASITVPESQSLDFRDVQAFSASEACLMTAGQPARFYHTEDGGDTWRITYEHAHPASFFDGMAFWNDRRGVAMSDAVDSEFVLLTTEDGGRSWQEVDPAMIDDALEGEGGFAASGTSIAVGRDGLAAFGTNRARVLVSSDWGKNWSAASVPIRTGAPSQGVFSMVFWGVEGHGTLVGGDYAADSTGTETAAFTLDKGLTWQAADVQPPCFLSAVDANPAQSDELLAAGTAGCCLSTDGGRHWVKITDTGYHTLRFAPGGKAAFSSGSRGRLARWERR